jgi:hypothetical protein
VIYLASGKERWWALMKTVMNIRILLSNNKRIDLLRNSVFSRLILLYGNNLYAVVFYVRLNFYASFCLSATSRHIYYCSFAKLLPAAHCVAWKHICFYRQLRYCLRNHSVLSCIILRRRIKATRFIAHKHV